MQSTADISALARQIRSWLTSITEGLRDWAASDRGQLVMSGVDFLTLSTRIGEFYAHAGWYLPVHPAFQRFALEHVTLSIPSIRELRLALPGHLRATGGGSSKALWPALRLRPARRWSRTRCFR